jgi:hypothetical protein
MFSGSTFVAAPPWTRTFALGSFCDTVDVVRTLEMMSEWRFGYNLDFRAVDGEKSAKVVDVL